MVIFPLAPDQTIAQMWSNGARGGVVDVTRDVLWLSILLHSAKVLSVLLYWTLAESSHSCGYIYK